MNVDKLPRWALASIVGPLLAVCLFFTSRAIAEGDKLKVVAYQAKNTAENAFEIATDLKDQIQEMRGAQETFRKEYRDDTIREADKLRQMEDRIVRAVKGA